MKFYRKTILFFFPCLFLILAVLMGMDNYDLLIQKRSVAFTYSQNLRQGRVGYGNQNVINNKIDLAELEPGDILLGGWPGCAYGRFSHAGLYLGNHKVLESYIETGVTINNVAHFRDYTRACIIRVKTDNQTRQRAIRYALKQRGKVFYPVSFKTDERYWNCTKIIWKSYQQQGINLDSGNDLWIPPDAFYRSPHVNIIAVKGGALN